MAYVRIFSMKIMFTLLILLWTGNALTKDQDNPIEKIVVLGDSLSDEGSLWNSTLGVFPPRVFYHQGRFTNGLIWTDYLQKTLPDVPVISHARGSSASYAAFASLFEAYLGFQIYELVGHPLWPSTLKEGLKTVGWVKPIDFHPSSSLVIIWVGSNNFIFGDHSHTTAVESIKEGVERLLKHDTQNILIVGLPDLSQVPFFSYNSPKDRKWLQNEIALVNNGLKSLVLTHFKKSHPNRVFWFDLNTRFHSIRKHVAQKGFNLNTPCLKFESIYEKFNNMYDYEKSSEELSYKDQFDVWVANKILDVGNINCTNPHKTFFWDYLHPSTTIHCLLALEFAQYLNKHFDLSLNQEALKGMCEGDLNLIPHKNFEESHPQNEGLEDFILHDHLEL
jgi:thermolabile hemolysin